MNHPCLTDIASRRASVDKALRSGTLSTKDMKSMEEGYAYVYKDHTLGMGHFESANLTESSSDYISFTVTTLDEDRDGDVVVPMGISIKNFARNPVWFFGHQEWAIPIGTSRGPDGRICWFPEENLAKEWFWPDKADEDAMFIDGKVRRGILNATSIAFVPLVAHRREQAKAHQHVGSPSGWRFAEVDKTETSVVGVPSNAGAIRDALDKEKSFIRPRLQKALSAYAAVAKGCWNGWCPVTLPTTKEKTMVVTKALNMRQDESVKIVGADGSSKGTGIVTRVNSSTIKVRTNSGVLTFDVSSGKIMGHWFEPFQSGDTLTKSLATHKSCGCSGACACGKKAAVKRKTQKDMDTDYDRGYVAAWDGRARSTNPYKNDSDPRGSEMRDDWDAGWQDGAKERLAGHKGKKQMAKFITVDGVRYKAVRKSDLMDYNTGSYIRPATPAEERASEQAAEHDGGAGVITVGGKSCYVEKAMGEDTGAAGGYAVKGVLDGDGNQITVGCQVADDMHNKIGKVTNISGDKVTFQDRSGESVTQDRKRLTVIKSARQRVMKSAETREGPNGDWWIYENGRKVDGPYDTEAEAQELIDEEMDFRDSRKSHRCTFCKGTGSGLGRRGDCPDCGGKGRVKGIMDWFGSSKKPTVGATVEVLRTSQLGLRAGATGKITQVHQLEPEPLITANIDGELYDLAGSQFKVKSMKQQRRKEAPTDDAPAHEVAMAHLYNHAKSESDYVTQALEGITPFDPTTGEANKAHGALKEYGEQVGQRMESLKGMFGEHCEGKDIDEAVKALGVEDEKELGDDATGEMNLVDNGMVPPCDEVEMDLDPVEADEDTDVTKADDAKEKSEPDEFAEDHGTEEILERYERSKAWGVVNGRGMWLSMSGKWMDSTRARTFASQQEAQQVADQMGESAAEIKSWFTRKAPAGRVAQVLRAGGRVVSKGGHKWLVAGVKKSLSKDFTPTDEPTKSLPPEHAEAVKACGSMLKGLAAMHDMPEHHKSALDMHGDAVAMGDPDAVGKALKHMKSLADAPDVPDHHKEALNHHAKAMAKALKAVGGDEPVEQKDDGEVEQTKVDEPVEEKAEEQDPATKSLFDTLRKELDGLNSKKRQVGIR